MYGQNAFAQCLNPSKPELQRKIIRICVYELFIGWWEMVFNYYVNTEIYSLRLDLRLCAYESGDCALVKLNVFAQGICCRRALTTSLFGWNYTFYTHSLSLSFTCTYFRKTSNIHLPACGMEWSFSKNMRTHRKLYVNAKCRLVDAIKFKQIFENVNFLTSTFRAGENLSIVKISEFSNNGWHGNLRTSKTLSINEIWFACEPEYAIVRIWYTYNTKAMNGDGESTFSIHFTDGSHFRCSIEKDGERESGTRSS